MKDLIEKGTVLAASNAALMATTATLIGAFNNRAGAAGEFLLPLYFFLGGTLVGGNVLLNWATRSSTDVETTFGRGVGKDALVALQTSCQTPFSGSEKALRIAFSCSRCGLFQ